MFFETVSHYFQIGVATATILLIMHKEEPQRKSISLGRMNSSNHQKAPTPGAC